jgi:hypothetical protein
VSIEKDIHDFRHELLLRLRARQPAAPIFSASFAS